MQSPAQFPPPGSRAVLFIRVSSEEQAKSDKDSLAEQERVLRAAADKFKWQVVDAIIIPGISASFYSYEQFVAEAERNRVTAPARMFDHWRRRDFDVLMVYVPSRLGRKQSIFGQMIEQTIDAGAVLWIPDSGLITPENYTFMSAMGGFAATTEVANLTKYRKMGVSSRVKRGLMSGDIPATHRLIRDEKGRGTHLELVPEWVEIMHRAADLLLSGIATSGNLEPQLFKLYGIGEANKPFRRYYIMKRFFNPLTYGNTYTGHIVRATEPSLWFAEPGHAQPADLKEIHYGTTAAVFTGDLRRRVLDYMSDFIEHRAGAGNKARSWHAGLVVCAECGYAANVRSATNHPPHVYRYLACSTVTRAKDNMPGERECSNRTFLREDALQEYVNILLKRMIEAQSLALVTQALGDVDTSALLATANARVDELSAKLKALLVDRAVATGSIRALYDEQYAELAAELDDAETQRNQYVIHQRPPDTRQQEAALSLITRLTLDTFWAQEPGVIRQTLRELLGGLRFAIEGGRVIGLTRFRR
jgi:DNA invertase Pin-like site-specific DNA recombinase